MWHLGDTSTCWSCIGAEAVKNADCDKAPHPEDFPSVMCRLLLKLVVGIDSAGRLEMKGDTDRVIQSNVEQTRHGGMGSKPCPVRRVRHVTLV